jgi:hypothetical protein
VTFFAEKIAGWPFDSEQYAIRAAEKFNEVAVSANLEDKTEFLFTAEVVEDKSGGWRVHIERSNGGVVAGGIGLTLMPSIFASVLQNCQFLCGLRSQSRCGKKPRSGSQAFGS